MTDPAPLPGAEFRWRFYDEDTGEKWSGWHTVEGACAACCCDGPVDGEHQEQSVYYDEFELPVFSGHTRLDPTDIEAWITVEWRS